MRIGKKKYRYDVGRGGMSRVISSGKGLIGREAKLGR